VQVLAEPGVGEGSVLTLDDERDARAWVTRLA